jgi:hypothetical protein
MMGQDPDFLEDGWCLEDGEERHAESPETFLIPDLAVRRILQPGDYAQLIFRIAVRDPDDPEAVERMWVIIRERTPIGYYGILANSPASILENDTFWRGAEIPFEPRHIIDVEHADERSLEIAQKPPPIPWLRKPNFQP